MRTSDRARLDPVPELSAALGTQVQTPEANHVQELLELLAQPGIEDRARMFLGYALGKELDDLERFDEAFPWFSLAAACAGAISPTMSPSTSAN